MPHCVEMRRFFAPQALQQRRRSYWPAVISSNLRELSLAWSLAWKHAGNSDENSHCPSNAP